MSTLIGLEEAAKRLGVSRFSLYAWARKGRLRTVKIGRRRLFPDQEIERVCREGLETKDGEEVGDSIKE